jgi:hypothetical protein
VQDAVQDEEGDGGERSMSEAKPGTCWNCGGRQFRYLCFGVDCCPDGHPIECLKCQALSKTKINVEVFPTLDDAERMIREWDWALARKDEEERIEERRREEE